MRKVCGDKKGVESPAIEDVEMAENTMEDAQGSEKWSQFSFLSPLAEKLLDSMVCACKIHRPLSSSVCFTEIVWLVLQEMSEVLIFSSFCGLAWHDSYTSNKCTGVAGLLYEKVRLSFCQLSHGELITPHVQRECHKVIGVGVHICDRI